MSELLYRKALVGDAHFADYHSRRLDNYRETSLGKVRQINEICKGLGLKPFQLGDWFHYKAPSKTSHRLIQDLIAVLDWDGIRGNHDMKDGSIDLEGQPLMSLVKAGVVTLLEGIDGNHFAGLGYREEFEKNPPLLVEAAQSLASSGAKVIAMHQSIFPPKTSWFPAIDLVLFDKVPIDGIVNGHIHDGMGLWCLLEQGWQQFPFSVDLQPIQVPSGTKWFLNVGSMMRGSVDEVAINRNVGFVIMDSFVDGSYQFTFVPIKVSPAAEVLKIREHLKAKSKEKEFEAFKNAVLQVGESKSLDLRTALARFCREARISAEVEAEAWTYLSEENQ